jgi:hypothetical protein
VSTARSYRIHRSRTPSVSVSSMTDELHTAPEAPAGALDAGENSSAVTRWDPNNYFWLSVLLPGAGQVAQRRLGAAAIQAATVGTYLVTAIGVGGGRAVWLALAWNVWSAIDAYLHAHVR